MGELWDYGRPSYMSRNSDDYVHCLVEYKTNTKDAILVAQNDEEFWIPFSQCAWETERNAAKWQRGQTVSITIRQWMADQKGIDYDY